MRIGFLLATLLSVAPCLAESRKLVMHEWGTFTSLQDESGETIGGINVDEEKLPAFVHTIQAHNGPPELSKGLLPGWPDVTMRLETPVLYFYPPADSKESVNIHVSFRGGLLTQFYPYAIARTPGAPNLSANTVGELTWKNVKLRTDRSIPATDSHVWLAPRNVKAVNVETYGEVEKYLFYRGLGKIDSPLVVRRSMDNLFVTLRASSKLQSIEKLWLYEIRPDGRCAFRDVRRVEHAKMGQDPAPVATFVDADFSSDNLTGLKQKMHAALVAEGLYADEADAMLSTWELSYFKSVGQRLFFVVPRAWTDDILPLKVSVDADITRVMVGRIDLVTPEQRQIARKLRGKPGPEESARLYPALGRFGPVLLGLP